LSNDLLMSNEVMKWDMKNTEHIVMSACETGKGQINADGVFGLSRAFLIVSHLKVDDKEIDGEILCEYDRNDKER
jgi:hypothetical protein